LKTPVTLAAVCSPAAEVVAREIEGAVLIIPLVDGIVAVDGELFTLNQTGKAIWQSLDGQRTLGEVAALLADQFAAPLDAIENEVIRFVEELKLKRLVMIHQD
jgi:hypothetical protein